MIYYAVPFMGDHFMPDCLTDVIEQDAYGRTLYRHSKLPHIGNEKKIVFVVYQKYDSEYVYYYEDLCYIFGTGSAEEIDQLKRTNDWDQPLDESKMSRRLAKISPTEPALITEDSDVETQKVRTLFLERIGGGKKVSDYWQEDISPSGQSAYVFAVETETNATQYYYVIVHPSYEMKSMEFESLEDLVQKLPEFKKECNWKYGW